MLMKEKMMPIISLLRVRAENSKRIAFLALTGVVFILLGGLYIFIFESSKIAAQDIKQQRKIGSSDEVISGLANLNISIHNNKEALANALKELKKIQDAAYRGWSEDRRKYYSKELKETSFYREKLDLESLDALLNEIKEINRYLESEDAREERVNQLSYGHKENLNTVKRLKAEEEGLRKRYSSTENATPEIARSAVLKGIETELAGILLQIQSNEQSIKAFDEKIVAGDLRKDAEVFVNNLLQVNKKFIEEIESNRPKLENYLDIKNKKYTKQMSLIEELRAQEADLAARKQVASFPNSDIESLNNDSKMAFYISTNIARFGVMIVTIFFAQVFISIYRYSIKIANFYHARADALEILTQTEVFESADLSRLIEMFSNILTPDKVDFGKIPQATSNEAIKSLQSMLKKD